MVVVRMGVYQVLIMRCSDEHYADPVDRKLSSNIGKHPIRQASSAAYVWTRSRGPLAAERLTWGIRRGI
jgi:hypothetical protein